MTFGEFKETEDYKWSDVVYIVNEDGEDCEEYTDDSEVITYHKFSDPASLEVTINTYLPEWKMENLRKICKLILQNKKAYPRYTVKYLVGCIYDLWLNYILSNEQENELYALVDPKERCNECSVYVNQITDNPLKECIGY